MDAYDQKDYKTAFEKLKPIAEQGHVQAQTFFVSTFTEKDQYSQVECLREIDEREAKHEE
ncbi:MAG TPA: hypothetical protein EYG62_07525 [Candidatus Marinimicrobia bacterium]|nr:hypothetical protein [Candidatus Neomarinimicrobiota bacterium]